MPEKESGLPCIDIREDDLSAISPEVLATLLRDHTTGKNIFWATHDYEALGSEYDYHRDQGDRSLIFYFERGRDSGVKATSVFSSG